MDRTRKHWGSSKDDNKWKNNHTWNQKKRVEIYETLWGRITWKIEYSQNVLREGEVKRKLSKLSKLFECIPNQGQGGMVKCQMLLKATSDREVWRAMIITLKGHSKTVSNLSNDFIWMDSRSGAWVIVKSQILFWATIDRKLWRTTIIMSWRDIGKWWTI